MTTIESVFAPVIGPATWGLIHFLWQGSLVALALVFALVCQGGKRATVRYRTACIALVLMMTLPFVTALTYQNTSGDPGPDGGVIPEIAFSQPTSTVVTGTAAGNGFDTINPGFSVTGTIERLRPWIFASWLMGVFMLALLHGSGWRRARRIKKTGLQPVSAEWREITTRLCRQMGLNRAVSFAISVKVEAPTMIGWLSPLVLIPVGAFTGLTQEQLRYLLAHEIAHVKRHDYLINLLQVLAETLLFFHPAVWWVSKQIRIERENCCDDVAVDVCHSRIGYARALVRLEEIRCYQSQFAMRADGGSLVSRIRRLTGGNSMSIHQNKPWLAGLCLAALLVAGGAVLSLAVDRSGDYATKSGDYAVEGKWELEALSDVLLMQVRVRERGNRWNMSFEFDKNEFTGLDYGEDDQFELHRDAGSFYFSGDFEGSGRDLEGYGKFGFVPDPEFAKQIGLRSAKDTELLILAAKDVGTEYIREMEKLGYKNLDGDKLVRMAIHGVSPEFAREMAEAGFDTDSADQLVKYRIHGVSPEFVRDLNELGYTNVDVDDLVRMRIHGVTTSYIRNILNKTTEDPSIDDLIKLKIHGIHL